MQQVYNGTPLPIDPSIGAFAEGVPYVIPPGEVVDIRNDAHAETLLRNFGARGLLRVRYGDELEELAQRSMEALRDHSKESSDERKRHNLEQARQGLRGAPPNPALTAMVKAAFGVEQVSEQDQNGLDVIRRLAHAVKGMPDGERKAKFSAAVDELAKLQAEADGLRTDAPDDPDAVPDDEVGGLAAVEGAKARARQKRSAKR